MLARQHEIARIGRQVEGTCIQAIEMFVHESSIRSAMRGQANNGTALMADHDQKKLSRTTMVSPGRTAS